MHHVRLSRTPVRWLVGALCTLVLLAALAPTTDGVGQPGTAHSAAVLPAAVRNVTPGDAAGIQPAIDAVAQAGGGTVYLPAGVYFLTKKVGVRSNVALVGDGMDHTILRWDPNPGTVVDNMMSNQNTSGNSGFQIRDMTLDGGGRTSATDASCCFGLRLRNVWDAYVINVAADGHSKDGFYLGFVSNGGVMKGVTNTRLSGCRARQNGRNGIAITFGSGNVVDGCRVEDNNRGEAVAGIDLEPDAGLAVTNNRIVSNTVLRQNVGIQLFTAFNGYAQVTDNVVCYNTTAGNGTGLYDFKSGSNIFVSNQHADNNPSTYYDTSPRIGSQYAGACQLGALPPVPGGTTPPPNPPPATPTSTPPPTSTPVPTPVASCQPRPAVQVNAVRGIPGYLLVTVRATTGPGAPNNRLHQVQIGAVTNGMVDAGSGMRPGGFAVDLPPNTRETTFQIRRTTPGASTTVTVSVVDDCGSWQTFVGGGPAAF